MGLLYDVTYFDPTWSHRRAGCDRDILLPRLDPTDRAIATNTNGDGRQLFWTGEAWAKDDPRPRVRISVNPRVDGIEFWRAVASAVGRRSHVPDVLKTLGPGREYAAVVHATDAAEAQAWCELQFGWPRTGPRPLLFQEIKS